jgi:heme exporter protein D
MIDFGKNAIFIWASYGVAFGGLTLLSWASYARMRTLERAAALMRDERRG